MKYILICLVCLGGLLIPYLLSAEENRPNLLVILTDDLRIGMLSSEGHPYIETPNLDRMGREGIRFSNAYVPSPACGPSRASLFTGQFPSIHQRRENFYWPDNYEYYLPQFFKDAGYKTALIGKYYEGNTFKETARKAWDHWFITRYSSIPIPPNMSRAKWREKFRYTDMYYDIDGKKTKIVGHETKILFDEAAIFATKQKQNPFMIVLSPVAPHWPYNASDQNNDRYRGRGLPYRNNLDISKSNFQGNDKINKLESEYERYSQMVADVDDAFGELLSVLEKNNQIDNTVIIFTSDNGFMWGEHGFISKRHAWQESIKVPYYVRYPKLVRPGSESKALISLTDTFFTLAEIAGVELPQIPKSKGKSLVPLLSNINLQIRNKLIQIQYELPEQDKPFLPRKILWSSIIRSDGWKYATYYNSPEQRPDWELEHLYQLDQDEFEMNNLAKNPNHEGILLEIKNQLRKGLEEVQVETSEYKL